MLRATGEFARAFVAFVWRLRAVAASVMRRALSVAEKPSVAKELANILSNGQAHRREGASPYNKIFEFQCPLDNGQCTMLVTSVVGHLMEARPARRPAWKPSARLTSAPDRLDRPAPDLLTTACVRACGCGQMDFEDRYRKWSSCDPAELFSEARVVTYVPEDKQDIKKNLEQAARCVDTSRSLPYY